MAEIAPGRPVHPEPRQLLARLGIDLDEVRSRAEATFGADALRRAAARRPRGRRRRRAFCTSTLTNTMWLPFCPRAKQALELAGRHADRRAQPITAVHLVLGILDTPGAMATRVLARAGTDLDAFRHRVIAVLDRPAA